MDKRKERIKRFKSNAEVQRKFGDLQGCLEFRKLAEELEKLEQIEQIINATEYTENGITYSYCYNQERKVKEIREVLEQE